MCYNTNLAEGGSLHADSNSYRTQLRRCSSPTARLRSPSNMVHIRMRSQPTALTCSLMRSLSSPPTPVVRTQSRSAARSNTGGSRFWRLPTFALRVDVLASRIADSSQSRFVLVEPTRLDRRIERRQWPGRSWSVGSIAPHVSRGENSGSPFDRSAAFQSTTALPTRTEPGTHSFRECHGSRQRRHRA